MLRILIFVAAVVYTQALPAEAPASISDILDEIQTPVEYNDPLSRFPSVASSFPLKTLCYMSSR